MQGWASRLQRQCAIDDQDPDHDHHHGSSMTTFRSRTCARIPCGQAFAELDDSANVLRVTNTVQLELRGPGRLLGPVAVPRVRDAVAANLRKLKELLER
jgi:hypothetical protein